MWKILDARGIRRVLLVTSAMHMPRSLSHFQASGICNSCTHRLFVTNNELQEPQNSPQATLLNLLPDAEQLHHFTRALKGYRHCRVSPAAGFEPVAIISTEG